MPLPLAHTIVGYAVVAATGIRFRRDIRTGLLFSLVVANLPDFDFLPGALRDDPVLYHRTIAHTLPAAVLVALIVAAVITRFRGRFGEIALLAFLVYSSHLFADMVDFSGTNGGVQILWPISSAFYTFEIPVARHFAQAVDFARGRGSTGFVESFAGLAFLRALLVQALLFAPLLLPAWWLRTRVPILKRSADA